MTPTNTMRWRKPMVMSSDGLSSIANGLILEQLWTGDGMVEPLETWLLVPVFEDVKVDDSRFPDKSCPPV